MTAQRSPQAALGEVETAIKGYEGVILIALRRSGATRAGAKEMLRDLYELQTRRAAIRKEMVE